MPLKSLIQGLAVVWLVLFAASFLSLQAAEDGGAQSGPARVATFLSWQLVAFLVAAAAALATWQAAARGVERVKVIGYGPLALSVFLVASFVALVAFQVYVAPLLE
jgi:hypothetical protein